MLVTRILYRISVAIARDRGSWLVMGGLAVLLAGFVAWNFHGGLYQATSASAAGAPGRGDCADVTMQALATGSATAARAAYGCLDSTLQQQTSEQAFVQQATEGAQTVGSSVNVTRVGEHDGADGGKVVFYSLDAQNQTVGYIVYLSPTGKVFKVE